MKTLFLTLLFFFVFQPLFSLDYSEKNSYFNHMKEVNKEWVYHQNVCPQGEISFQSEEERICLHLNLVCDALLKHPPSLITLNALKYREKLIFSLQNYADNKIFPINLFHKERRPYFIDHRGVHCAVGYLMKESGNEKLAQRIKLEHNYDYVKDIKTDGVTDWAINYGFTLQELMWIQPGYPQNYFDSIYGGTNGPVTGINATNSGYLIVTGEFDSLNDIPCLKIGKFANDQFSCFGDGLNGKINDVLVTLYSNNLFACGEILNATDTFPYAIFENEQWNYYNIPTREGAVGHCCFRGGDIELSISHYSKPGRQELWFYNDTYGWQLVAEVDGVINDIHPSGYGRIYGGKFDSVFVYNNSVITDTILAKNVVIKENNQPNWFGLGTALPDTVKTIEVLGSTVYFAGSCDSANPVALTRFLNNTFQPLILYNQINYYVSGNISINKIMYSSVSETIMISGNFGANTQWFGPTNYLGNYDLIINSFSLLGYFNGTVKSFDYYNDVLIFGGDFTTNLNYPMNHIARSKTHNSGINDLEGHKISLFPNPCQEILNVELTTNDLSKLTIYDVTGKIVYSKENIQSKSIQINTSSFPKGVYSLTIEDHKNQRFTRKFIKV